MRTRMIFSGLEEDSYRPNYTHKCPAPPDGEMHGGMDRLRDRLGHLSWVLLLVWK